MQKPSIAAKTPDYLTALHGVEYTHVDPGATAEIGTSVSALVRTYLVALVRGDVPDTRFDRLRRLQDETLAAIRTRGGGLRTADNLKRDELHQRDALP